MVCTLAMLAAAEVQAQSPFPPVGGAPAASPFPLAGGAAPASPFPPVGGGGAFGPPQPQREPPCLKDFAPLRAEAERRAGLIKAASQRKAPPAEACKLIRGFAEQESKMLKFMQARAASCGIPPQVTEQIRSSHANTLQLQTKVCAVANAPQGAAGPSLSEALGSPGLPEASPGKRSGGSTFDTLSGNVLTK
ncbi:MAG: hypothetical protein EPO23_06920 [Xanthobacteraceae bacterium]|nr:MAG: hypothetical protein EPO23_06920 [Xanthobacteraceae bacterium]